ncbi:MAG: exodeoxyribonuclease VII large subunit [Candidatus Omnitrophica bacterium]|nr:exodeoxyribonuclease VII large subunit [Candidatus Omnitrophota bacterium]
MDNVRKTEKVYSVQDLNTTVRRVLKTEFPDAVWVCGEIQDFRPSRDRRHIYFSLVEKHPEADTIVAKAGAALFQGRAAYVMKKLREVDPKFTLKNDIEIKVKCELDLYPKSGNFNLIITDIDPVYTMGRIAQSRLKIVAELKKLGLLEKNKERRLPEVPLRIGLITAAGSAAYHDFTNELSASGLGFQVRVCDCHMQGHKVEPEVVRALKYFHSAQELDVIVITRGGGATADLSWFDSKPIAREVARARVPVLSALGHQIDVTVTDLVSHTTVKTPTKVAQFLVERARDFTDRLTRAEEGILKEIQRFLPQKRTELERIAVKIDGVVPRFFRTHREALLQIQHRLGKEIDIACAAQRHRLARSEEQVAQGGRRVCERAGAALAYAEGKVKILKPENTLKRGYSITYFQGRALKSGRELTAGDQLRTVFADGETDSRVIEESEGK